MREVKNATVRKNEILDVAEQLFVLNGYDNTSTGDILEKTGIARGTLYYHFKSKEDILDALISRIVDKQILKIKEASHPKNTAVEQIASFIGSMKVESSIGEEISNEVHKPQNALMHQKMQKRLLDSIIPLAADMLKEGSKRNLFNVKYPEEAAEMLILYSSIVFDDLYALEPKKREKKVVGFIHNMERLLGVDESSLSILIKSI